MPTVVTTHSSIGDISKMFGPAISSRLLEGPAIDLVGTDRRDRKLTRLPREAA